MIRAVNGGAPNGQLGVTADDWQRGTGRPLLMHGPHLGRVGARPYRTLGRPVRSTVRPGPSRAREAPGEPLASR